MSEICCTRLAGNTGRKNYAKIAIWAGHHRTICRAMSSQLRHCIDNRKQEASADRTARRQFQAGLWGDVGL